MYKKLLLSLLLLTGHFLTGCTQSSPSLKNQFVLHPHMVINESGCGYGTFVTDEQHILIPETFWNGHDKEHCKAFTPVLILDLLQKIQITDVYINSEGSGEGLISSGKVSDLKVTLKSGWNKVILNTESQYIAITLKKGVPIGEILVDASKKYSVTTKVFQKRKRVLMQDFLGTNAFVDVPPGLLEPFGCVREYHDWPDWNEPQKDSFYLNVSKQGFDFENFYKNMRKADKLVIPVLQKSPKWLTGETNVQAKPIPKGSKADNPAVYTRHALFMSKFVSNFSKPAYGNLEYFENWNEPDKWWESGLSYFTPYQYAAMSSADIDGHLGKSGNNLGIKRAKGQSKLVMAGLANPKTDYIHALKYWCDKNRAGNFAWDVINYHRYSNSSGLPDTKPEKGVSPEEADIYTEAKNLTSFRDQFLPQTEIWMTEFGYDTENSPQQCKPIGNKTSEQVQADWLLRSYILLSAAGIEKAFQYMIRDFGKTGLYATSGFYSTTVNSKPYIRPSWNYINTLKYALYDSYFEKITLDTTSKIYTAVYANKNNPDLKTKVIWIGSSSGATKKISLPNNSENSILKFSDQSPCGEQMSLTDNSVLITETPLVLRSLSVQKLKPCSYLKPVSVAEIKCKDFSGKEISTLLDEQENSNTKMFEISMEMPILPWKKSYQTGSSNGIVFYFSTEKMLHSVLLFDGAGEGEIEISVKNQEGWKTERKLKMNQYNKWKTVVLNTPVTEIKIEKTMGSPDVGEVVFFEKSTK